MRGHLLASPRAFKDENSPSAAGGVTAGIATRLYDVSSIAHPNDWLERVYAGRYMNEWQRNLPARFIDKPGEQKRRDYEEGRLAEHDLRDESLSRSPRRERKSALRSVPESRVQDANQAAERAILRHAGRHPPSLSRHIQDCDDSVHGHASRHPSLSRRTPGDGHSGRHPPLLSRRNPGDGDDSVRRFASSQLEDRRQMTAGTPRLDTKTKDERTAAADAQVWARNQYQDPRLCKEAAAETPAGMSSRAYVRERHAVRNLQSVMDVIIGHDEKCGTAENVSTATPRVSERWPYIAEARIQEKIASPRYPAGIEDGCRGQTENRRQDYALCHGWLPSREPEWYSLPSCKPKTAVRSRSLVEQRQTQTSKAESSFQQTKSDELG